MKLSCTGGVFVAQIGIYDYVSYTNKEDVRDFLAQVVGIQHNLFSNNPDFILKPTGYHFLGGPDRYFKDRDLSDDITQPDFVFTKKRNTRKLTIEQSFHLRAILTFGDNFHSVHFFNSNVVIGETPCGLKECDGIAEIETVMNRYGSVGFIITCQKCHDKYHHRCSV